MSHLLDTHTLLWALTDPSRLGPEAHRVASDRRTRLVVSAVSPWEISAKHRSGRLPQADVIIGGYRHHLDRLGVIRMPATEEHCLLGCGLDWAHRDPFDRLLAAQAMMESMTLVTNDAAFDGLSGLRTVW